MRTDETREEVSKYEEELISNFAYYLDYFDQNHPFRNDQLKPHQETINRLRILGNVKRAIYDNEFIESLVKTLYAWGLYRGAELLSEKEISNNLRDLQIESQLTKLEAFFIDAPNLNGNEIAKSLWELINNEKFKITSASNKIVSCSKTLHHLLPDLVPPIDRAYTRAFFRWYGQQFQYKPKEVFLDIFEGLVRIAKNTPNLRQYVTNKGWRTSRTKLIDNAIIGFCLKNELYLS